MASLCRGLHRRMGSFAGIRLDFLAGFLDEFQDHINNCLDIDDPSH